MNTRFHCLFMIFPLFGFICCASISQPKKSSSPVLVLQSLFSRAEPIKPISINVIPSTANWLYVVPNRTRSQPSAPIIRKPPPTLAERFNINPNTSMIMLVPSNRRTSRLEFVNPNSILQNPPKSELNTLEPTFFVSNESSLLQNPFEAAPYQSSNEVINSIISNIFGNISLQTLPPDDILFGGKLNRTFDSKQAEKIFEIAPVEVSSTNSIFNGSKIDRGLQITSFTEKPTIKIFNISEPFNETKFKSNLISFNVSNFLQSAENSTSVQPELKLEPELSSIIIPSDLTKFEKTSSVQPELKLDLTSSNFSNFVPELENSSLLQPELNTQPELAILEEKFVSKNDHLTSEQPSLDLTEVQPEEPSDVQPELPSEVPSVVQPELPSEVPSDVQPELPSEVPSDVQPELPSEVSSEVSSEVQPELPSEVPSDVQPELPSEVPLDVPLEVSLEVPLEVPSVIPSEVPSEVQPDVRSEVQPDVRSEVQPEVLSEVSCKVQPEFVTVPLNLERIPQPPSNSIIESSLPEVTNEVDPNDIVEYSVTEQPTTTENPVFSTLVSNRVKTKNYQFSYYFRMGNMDVVKSKPVKVAKEAKPKIQRTNVEKLKIQETIIEKPLIQTSNTEIPIRKIFTKEKSKSDKLIENIDTNNDNNNIEGSKSIDDWINEENILLDSDQYRKFPSELNTDEEMTNAANVEIKREVTKKPKTVSLDTSNEWTSSLSKSSVDNLINIISLPNYKFYLGKKSSSKTN